MPDFDVTVFFPAFAFHPLLLAGELSGLLFDVALLPALFSEAYGDEPGVLLPSVVVLRDAGVVFAFATLFPLAFAPGEEPTLGAWNKSFRKKIKKFFLRCSVQREREEQHG